MLKVLQLVALLVVAVALAAVLANVLELPGKMRLSKDAHFSVQSICHPGFTIAAASGPIAALDSERLRNRREYSDAVRARLAGGSFMALAICVCVL